MVAICVVNMHYLREFSLLYTDMFLNFVEFKICFSVKVIGPSLYMKVYSVEKS